jgi:hypothetical protein
MKRIILLTVLLFEGLGGILLAAAPDGHLMNMPVSMMNGVFLDFFIPGIILTAMGLITTFAYVAVLRRMSIDWFLAGVALIGFTIWFSVEIAILRELHWLHIVSGVPVLVGIWAAIPLVHPSRK